MPNPTDPLHARVEAAHQLIDLIGSSDAAKAVFLRTAVEGDRTDLVWDLAVRQRLADAPIAPPAADLRAAYRRAQQQRSSAALQGTSLQRDYGADAEVSAADFFDLR